MPDATGKLVPGDLGYVAPGSGLINANPAGIDLSPKNPVTGYTPATATATKPVATGYDPTMFSVTPNQTVAEQVKSIVAADSPLMQQAAARAAGKMNERGLLNSSLAVGAGQEAVLGAALPIGQADAQVYERANTNSVNAQNAAKGFKATAENAAEQTGAQLVTDVNKTNALQINTALGKQADAALQKQMQVFDTTTKTALATLDAQNRQLLQTNTNAANMFQEVVKNIAAIATSTTMSQQAKDDATKSQLNLLNEGLRTTAAVASTEQAAVKSLNLSAYFGGGETAVGGPVLAAPGAVPGTGGLIQGESAPAPNTLPLPSTDHMIQRYQMLFGIPPPPAGQANLYDPITGNVYNPDGSQIIGQMPAGLTQETMI